MEADRKVFSKLIEQDLKPRKAGDGSYPLDKALGEALTSYEVSFCLMHLPLKGSNAPPSRPNKIQRRAARQELRPWPCVQQQGRGPEQEFAALGVHSTFTRDRGGVASLPSGEAVCFDFNIHGSASASLTPALASTCVPSALAIAPLRITRSD